MTATASGGARSSNLPNLLVIGAMKAGTTTLWREFERIPDIEVARHKETELFGDGWNHASLSKHAAQDYSSSDSAKYRANFDTSLTKIPAIKVDHSRVIEALGKPKVIMMTREPVERLISHHGHAVRRRTALPNINDELARRSWLVDFSRYAFQLEPWAQVVPDDDILVTSLERYRFDRSGFLAEIGDFLDVDVSSALAGDSLQENVAAVGYGSPTLERALTGGWYQRRVSPRIPPRVKEWLRENVIRPATPAVESGWDEVPLATRERIEQQFAADRAEMIERWGIDPHTGMR